MQVRILRLAFACLAIFSVALPGVAAADRLLMKNGDVISGDISGIAGGKVNIKPAYSDAIAVDLTEVASIQADQKFNVMLQDGSEVEALLDGDAAGQQRLIVGEQSVEAGLGDITILEPPKPWYKRVSHVDANGTWNSGNTDNQSWLIFGDTRVRLGDHRHLAELTMARDETDGVATKKQDLFNYEYNWLFNDPWYLGANAQYERDPIKDLEYRYTLGALLGRDIVSTDTLLVTFSVGAGWSDQKQAGVEDSGGVGLWKFAYEQGLRDKTLTLFHNDSINYQFYGANDLVFKSNTGFRFNLSEKIYSTVSFRYDYETEPAPGKKKYDSTLAVGLGTEF